MNLKDAIIALMVRKVDSEKKLKTIKTFKFRDKEEETILRGRIKSYKAAIEILSNHSKKAL